MKKLLIVEDNEHNLELLSQLLEDDFQISIARNGIEAIETVRNEEVDVVIMDLSMPEMDGWTAIRELRKQTEYESLPIIALSAHAMKGEREKALEAGASEFITKPVEFQTLFETLSQFV